MLYGSGTISVSNRLLHYSMKYLLSLIPLLLFNLQLSAQEAFYPVTNYSTKDYGRDLHPTNMSIAQDLRGIIYAANGFRLLEYDASTWNSYPINKETWILSLAIDSSGIIYAGSQNEFGLFIPDEVGELQYRSLSDSLDIQDLDFTNVWNVHAFSGGVVYQSEEKIFIYRNGKINTIKSETSFHTSFIVNNRFFVRERGTGLMELKDSSLEKIKGGEIFDTTGIFLMLPFGKGSTEILIGTRDKGLWLFEPDNNSGLFRFFTAEDPELLEKSKITGGILTGDGSFAISTLLNGVIIIDTLGKTRSIINSTKGLSDNDVKQIMLDRSNNLWVALNNGISRIEISSPLSFNTSKSGITGSINTISGYKDLLYVGSTTGLFVRTPDNKLPFRQAFNLNIPVRCLIEAEGSLLAGTDAGIFMISGKNIRKIDDQASVTLFYSPELSILLSGGPKGLSAYSYESSFSKSKLLVDGEDIISITEENNRTGPVDEFWLGTRYNGVIRIKLEDDLTIISDRYSSSDGIPDGLVLTAGINSVTLFATSQGLYSFTNENIVRQSVPDSLKNNADFSKGYFSLAEDSYKIIGESVSFLAETGNKVWICSDNKVGYLDKANDMKWVNRPFNGIEAGKINCIYPEENGICWIGTTDGLIRYDGNTGKVYDEKYPVLIRKVTLPGQDSTIFMGANSKTDIGNYEILTEQSVILKSSLSFGNNSIRIEFSAPFYEYSDKIYYSYQLEGMNSRWSQWTQENFREYTNLHEGNYTFNVKARNIYGTESLPAHYSFVVLPPWYRSAPAYFSYFILATIILWLVARIYSYRLKRENIRLEGIVSERTAEVVRQKDEIVSKNTILEYQKKEIEDSIRYASRIQSAVIPSESVCRELLPESFVVFKPLNIVSGDFYWISNNGNKTIFTAADCTGHGVPGAFMSMLGVAFLNEIVNKDNVTAPDMILNQLREKVIQALQQQGIYGEARDGMDIAIVSIDKKDRKLEYAGAYNPLIMIRNGEIIETAGDKMPIGIYENMRAFSNHVTDIEKGDVFYMFSDGYEDQFGGPDGKKLKSKRLKQLLVEIHKFPMERQKEVLENTFEEWKGDLPQIDDVVVVGLLIS